MHARVSEALENELKHRASRLGMSVSTLVRNILKDTVGFVEEVMAERTLEARGSSSVVLAWQEAVLNRNAVCDECNAILPRGTRAAVGLLEGPGPRQVVCTDCLAKLSSPDGNEGDPTTARA